MASAEAAAKLSGLALTFVLARVLHPAGYGAFAVAYAFGSIFGVACPGVQPLAIREISRHPRATRGLLWTGLWIRGYVGLAALALAACIAAFVPFDAPTKIAGLTFALSVVLDGMTAQAMTLFRGRQTMGIEARVMSAARFANLVVTLVAVAIVPDVVHVAAASALTSLGLVAYALRLVARDVPPARLRPRAARVFFMHALPYAAGALLVYVFFRIDVLVLRFLGVAEAAIGTYSAAYRVMEVTRVPSAVLAQGFGPAAARFRRSPDRTGLIALASRTWTLTLAIALPSVIAFVLAGGLVVHVVFGNAYRAAIPMLLAMSAMPAFMAFNGVAIQTVNSQGKQRSATIIFGVCAVVNVVANLILIPRIGALGAAFATILTEVVQTVALLAWLVRSVGIPRPALATMLAGLCGALAAGFAVPAKFAVPRLALALLVYAAVIAASRLRRTAGQAFA